MNGSYQPEQEIDLRRLAGYFLRNLKSILIITVLVTIVCGALFSYKSYNSRLKEIDVKTKELAKLELEEKRIEEEKAAKRLLIEQDRAQALSTYEYNHENAIIARDIAQEIIDKQMQYMEESYQYRLDPQNVYTSSLWIKAAFDNELESQKDNANSQILAELKNFEFELKRKPNKEKIADIAGLKGTNRLDYFGEVFSASVDGTTLIMTVSIVAENAEKREKIEEYFNELLMGYSPRNNKLTLYIANEEDTEGYSAGIYNAIFKQDEALKGQKKDLEVKTRAIQDLEAAEAKRLRDNKADDAKELENERLEKEAKEQEKAKNGIADLTVNIKKIIIKGIIAGIFAGLFIGCGLYAAKYIFSGVINSVDEISSEFGIRELGNIRFTSDEDGFQIKGKSFIKLTKWIEGTNDNETRDQSEEIVRINISNHLEDEKKVAVVSSMADESVDKVVGLVNEELEANGVEAVKLNFALDKITALKEIKKCDKAIIIEEEGKTKRKDVIYEISEIKDLKKEIIGVIGVI